MARTAMQGWETDAKIETGTTLPSGVTLDAVVFRSGLKSLKIVAPSGSSAAQGNSAILNGDTKYTRVYVRVATLPSTTRILLGVDSNAFSRITLASNGVLTFSGRTSLGVDVPIAQAAATLLTDATRWYCVEWRAPWLGMAVGDPVFRVDGEICNCINAVTASTISMSIAFGASDTVAATYTANFDDAAQDDTDWVGEGHVVLSVPASDNNRGAWTGGAGGTTNLFDAVNNLPPVGVAAASATNTSQISSATNSSSDNCDLNMQSYTTAGVPSGARVNGVMAIVASGEQIATGTKAGALKIVSNPTQSVEDSFNFGNDAGAEGTYPTTWSIKYGTTQNAPSVTLGTQPVLRVGKRTATTRVVDACFLGLYIDYTPKSIPPHFAARLNRPQFYSPRIRRI